MKNKINATIQLDKLVFSCSSTVEDNFTTALKEGKPPQSQYIFNETTITRTIDMSKRYRYSYLVNHTGNQMGRIDFCQHGESWIDGRIRFTVDNTVFYCNTLKLLPVVLDDLNFTIENYTKIEIAIDNYRQNVEQFLRRNLKDKSNTVKLFGRIIKERGKLIKSIVYCNHGSLNNPFKQRTIYLKNKKDTFELKAYNKAQEIESSGKTYIAEYHKTHNPKYRKIFRTEIELKYEEIRRYQAKHGNKITLKNLLRKPFLYELFREYLDRIIVFKNIEKKKIEFIYPQDLGLCGGL